MSVPAGKEHEQADGSSEITRLIEETGNESFKVEAEVRGGEAPCAILRFVGSLTNRDSRVLRNLLGYLNRKPVKIVILDLSRVAQIDSTPLAALLMFVKERESMRYALACALVLNGPSVHEKMKTLGIAPLFEIFENLQEAEYNLGLSGGQSFSKRFKKHALNIQAKVKLITSQPRAAVVTLFGHIQEPEAEYLSWLLRQICRRGARSVVIDVSGISYANTPAYGVLVGAARIWHEAYGKSCIALAGLNAGIKRTIELLGIQNHFVITTTVEKACRILKGDSVSKFSHPTKKAYRPSRRL
jgi:anti-anti-sigma factor